MSLVRRVARPMIASIFVIQGLDAFRHPAPLAQRSSPLLDKAIPLLGLPNDKQLLVRANGVTQMAGGIMLATGFLPRLGALAIAASLVPTTLAGHPFWKEEEPQQQPAYFASRRREYGREAGARLARSKHREPVATGGKARREDHGPRGEDRQAERQDQGPTMTPRAGLTRGMP